MGEARIGRELVQRVQLGDSESRELFGTLLRKMYIDFLNYRLSDKLVVEELAHNAIVRILENLKTYKEEPGVNFDSWAYSIVRNLLSNHYRDMSRRKHIAWNEFVEVLTGTTFESSFEFEQLDVLKALNESLQALSKGQREAILLQHIEDHTLSDSASAMHTSIDSIKSFRHKALLNLRRLLHQRNIHDSPFTS